MIPLTDVVKNLLIINVLVYVTLNFLLPQFELQPYFSLYPFESEMFRPIQVVTSMFNHDPRRPRKLLLHKRELRKFAAAADHDGLTMIPLSMYFSNGKAKVQIAVGKGRKLHDKRQKMKETEANKEIRRAMSKRTG